MSDAIPGWYPDPVTPGQQRYWDGTQWTENVAAMPTATPPMPPPGYAPTPPPYTGYGMPGYGAPMYGAPQPGLAYAHWGLRFAGYLLDGLLAVPFFIAASIIAANNTTTTFDSFGNSSTSTTSGAMATALILRLVGLAIIIWNQCYRQGRTGYSIGKQVVGIKLIREATGEPLGGWSALGRQFLHILDELPVFLGFLWPIWDRKKQTFADKIMKSVVIVEPKPRS